MDARLAFHFIKAVRHVGREKLAQRPSQRDMSWNAGEFLDLGVPALDSIVKVDGHNADIDRFDDVFAEFLEALVFLDFLLERTVETAILDCDRDISGKRDQQLEVVAGQKIALVRTADAEIGDRATARIAWNVIRQVKVCDGVPHASRHLS